MLPLQPTICPRPGCERHLCVCAAAEAAEEAAAEPGVPDAQLVELLVKNEIARRVTQMYVLERLSRLDVATARDMLASLVPALERLSKVFAPMRLTCIWIEPLDTSEQWSSPPGKPPGMTAACACLNATSCCLKVLVLEHAVTHRIA